MKTKNVKLRAIGFLLAKAGKFLCRLIMCGLSAGLITFLLGIMGGVNPRECLFWSILATLFGVGASIISYIEE